MANFAERQHDLQELASTPDLDPVTLEGTVWEVVGNALYERSKDDTQLLPATRPLVEKLATHEELFPDSDSRLNANILLGTWGVLSAFARGAPVTDAIRLASRRRLGALVSDMTNGSFNLDELSHEAAQKMSEVITLQLLQRSKEASGVFGLLAQPSAHHFEGIDEATGTTSFQLHAAAPDRIVPIYTSRFPQERMQETGRHKGVLIVALGKLMMTSAKFVSPIMVQSKAQGSITKGQRWMTSRGARALALEVGPHAAEVLADESLWLDHTTKHLATLVGRFNPSSPAILSEL